MFYFTRKTQEFHVDCVTFNRPQYEHSLSPCDCLVRIQLPPIHEKASVAWLLQSLRRFGPSGVAALIFLRLHRNIQEQIKSRFRNRRSFRWLPFTKAPFSFELFEPEMDVVHMRWFPSKFIPELNAEHSLSISFPRTARHFARLLCLLTLSTACNRDNDRHCDLERALGGDTRCATELV
jgi:hypothetical protein